MITSRYSKSVRSRRGFTLMELLTVMIIMALMMSIAAISFFKARQGAEMRGAVRALQTTISLARQQAVVKHTPVSLTLSNTTINNIQSGCMTLSTVSSATNMLAHDIRFLPPWITFDAPCTLRFETDGSAVSGGVTTMPISMTQQKTSPLVQTNRTFNLLIGAMQE